MIATTLAATPAFSVGSSRALSPERFAAIASGVVLIRTSDCAGQTTGWGSGFLVGARLAISARHVVDPPDGEQACRIDVRSAGTWIRVEKWNWWHSGGKTGRVVDLATLKLDAPATGYLFEIRGSRMPNGTNLAMVGFPLGTKLAFTQGKLILSKEKDGVPLLAVRLLGGEGASGAPFVDDQGRVVGILQVGLGSEDILGQRTAGVVVGLDLVAWWGSSARRDLCKAYPAGGIPDCGSAPAPVADSKALGLSAMVRAADLDVDFGANGTWRLVSTKADSSASGPCSEYVLPGRRFAQKREFENSQTGDSFTQYVWVYGSPAEARKAYALTASTANLDCQETDMRDYLETASPEMALTDLVAGHQRVPPFGSMSSGGSIWWERTETYSGEVETGVWYWVDVVAGRTVHGFTLWADDSYGETVYPTLQSFVTAYAPLIRAAVNRTR